MHVDPELKLHVVRLQEDPIDFSLKTFPDWWNVLIETVCLGRIDLFGYRNQVRANLRVFSALQATFVCVCAPMVCVTYVLFEIAPSAFNGVGAKEILAALSTVIASFAAIFWKEKTSIHSKWEYLAGLYNQICAESPVSSPDQYPARDVMRVALALDLIVMEMWAHRSFSEFFYDILVEAIMDHTRDHQGSGRWMVDHLLEKSFPRTTAEAYLSAYQARLLSRVGAKTA